MNKRLDADFFHRDVLETAPDLVGKILVHRLADGTELRERIAETEAYRGEEDKGCHAAKGRTTTLPNCGISFQFPLVHIILLLLTNLETHYY